MNNRAFWRACHALVHPVMIAAVVMLLFNDHWLRLTYPSWLTGKLGDWTWLMFAPLIAALPLAMLIPRRLHHQERIVGIIAFSFIGLWFALAKTVPVAHLLTTSLLDAIVGWKGTLRLDPTDLFMLPALLPAWMIWRQAKNTEPELSPGVWTVLAMGIMGTLANSPSIRAFEGIETL
ncbi:MAG TPA: hypothetical protein VHL11_13385, partial [Phototrophicaceae bacterium]|nr:hypothetical protein [Phototrophicaceae bacterium]